MILYRFSKNENDNSYSYTTSTDYGYALRQYVSGTTQTTYIDNPQDEDLCDTVAPSDMVLYIGDAAITALYQSIPEQPNLFYGSSCTDEIDRLFILFIQTSELWLIIHENSIGSAYAYYYQYAHNQYENELTQLLHLSNPNSKLNIYPLFDDRQY